MLRRLVLAASCFLMVAVTQGCSASSKWMHPATGPKTLKAPADKALVVVMRPSGYGSGVRFTVMDGQGQFLGQPLATSFYTLELPPGSYTFVASAENADMMQATLAAGKIYYVLASVRMGMWSARVALTAFTPRSEEWEKRDKWIQSSDRYTADLAGGARHLSEHADDVKEKLADANKAWASYDAAHKEERTLRAEDGM